MAPRREDQWFGPRRANDIEIGGHEGAPGGCRGLPLHIVVAALRRRVSLPWER